MKSIGKTFALLAITFAGLTTARAQDPLPSWNDTAPKKAIVAFVEKVTKEGSSDFSSRTGKRITNRWMPRRKMDGQS